MTREEQRSRGKVVGTDRVLIVGNDMAMIACISNCISNAGYDVFTASGVDSPMEAFWTYVPSIVIVVAAAPGSSGLQLCRDIRCASNVPIVMCSKSGREDDIVQGLSAGADNYLAMPVSEGDLVAVVFALLRRAKLHGMAEPGLYADSLLNLDLRRHEVRVREKIVHLTPIEFRLLTQLVQGNRGLVSHRRLLDNCWSPGIRTTNRLRWHMSHLRKKLEKAQGCRGVISAVEGFGYRYDPYGYERYTTEDGGSVNACPWDYESP